MIAHDLGLLGGYPVRSATLVLTWVLGTAMTGCGGASDSGGGVGVGGSAVGGAGVGQTTSVGTSTGTGGGAHGGGSGDGGAGGQGGSGGPECVQNCVKANPIGARTYAPLVKCVYCDACYVDCDGAAQTDPVCEKPGMSVCDNSGDCGLCKDCAFEATCIDAYQACKAEPECIAYANCIAPCSRK
jgi:hypothetical protein